MKLRIFLLLGLLAAVSCGLPKEEAPSAPAPPKEGLAADKPERDIDGDNLLNLAYGASVVSRTGESSLEQSSVNAIDGIATTPWSSASYAHEDTLEFSFLAPAQVTRLGVTTSTDPTLVPDKVSFEWSSDGTRWHPALTMEPKAEDNPQISDVTPFTARYLRVHVEERKNMYAVLYSVHAIGQEIAPPQPASSGGCWMINGVEASLFERGARVTGTIATSTPTMIEGGTDGRVIRVNWTRGPMWGHAVFTMTPDGTHMAGLEIHEDINLQNRGSSLFGTRCKPSGSPDVPGAPPDAKSILDRTGRWPMFGLAFAPDNRLLEAPSADALDALVSLLRSEPAQRFRVTAHELRDPSPEQNRRQTDGRIASIRTALQSRGADLARIDFVSAGNDWKTPLLSVAIQRLLASRVDVERVR